MVITAIFFGVPVGIVTILIAGMGAAFSNCNLSTPPIRGVVAPDLRLVSIALSPDGKRACAVDSGPGAVEVIDTECHAVIGTVFVGGTPTGIAVSPDGTRVCVTSTNVDHSNGYVSVINPSDPIVIAKIPVGSGTNHRQPTGERS